MPSPSGDPLRLLADARRTGAPPPALTDLGGPAILTDARHDLLDHDDLPALVTLVCNDAPTLASPTGRDFLLTAAVPDDPLLLEEVVTALLTHPGAIEVLGEDLADAWLDASRTRLDLVGGIALEASARLILAGIASHYGLLDRLRRLRRELPRIDEDFAARAVRVAGALAEHFSAPETPSLLEDLLDHDDVADDAAFELGMLTLRQALTTDTLDQARPQLLKARAYLSDAHCTEERPDAAGFGAALDALLAYSSGATISTDTLRQLQDAILDIRLNLLGLPPAGAPPPGHPGHLATTPRHPHPRPSRRPARRLAARRRSHHQPGRRLRGPPQSRPAHPHRRLPAGHCTWHTSFRNRPARRPGPPSGTEPARP